MNIISKLTVNTALALLSVATITSCSNEPKDSKEQAEKMNDNKFSNDQQKDADCLVNAYSSNLFEIKMSENVAMNASSMEVKKLAGMIVEAHTKMNKDVAALAEKKQVTLPTDLTDDQRRKIEKLAEKNGMDYDKEYVELMKDKHQDAIKTYEKDSEKCVDADIKTWASQTIPEVRSHLDMVEVTWSKIKDMK